MGVLDVPPSASSAVSLVNPTVVTSQAAMLALPGDVGDSAIRTDIGKTFMLQTLPATTLANWVEVLSTDGVQTVNGRPGPAVTGLAEQSALEGFAVQTNQTFQAQGDAIGLRATKVYVDSQNATSYGMRASNQATSAASITPDPLIYYEYDVTALASTLTLVNTVVTPQNGATFQLIIKDDGTAKGLSWGTLYVGVNAALPSTTIAGKVMTLVFRYSAARARWELQTIRQEV